MDVGLISITLLGVGLVWLGGSILFSKRGLEWWYKHGFWSRSDSIFGEKQAYLWDRYIGGSRFFLVGLAFLPATLVILFGNVSTIWISVPYLVLGIFFLVVSLLLFFSKKFKKFFWGHIYYQYKESDEWRMAGGSLLAGLMMFFGFYLFSGVFLYWPN